MAYELIPGYKQDCKGRTFQLARYPNGKLIEVEVKELPALSAKLRAGLEKCTVETRSLLPLDNQEAWVSDALERGSLYRQGDKFESMVCYQGAQA